MANSNWRFEPTALNALPPCPILLLISEWRITFSTGLCRPTTWLNTSSAIYCLFGRTGDLTCYFCIYYYSRSILYSVCFLILSSDCLYWWSPICDSPPITNNSAYYFLPSLGEGFLTYCAKRWSWYSFFLWAFYWTRFSS